ncbi:MAG TPA: nucleotidyltransferase family protein [Candidatus Dormibacteraeota bacterium]
MDADVWLAMQRLGSLEPGPDAVAAALDALRAAGPGAPEIARRLVQGKVAQLAAANLAPADGAGPLAGELRAVLAAHLRELAPWRHDAGPHVRAVLALAAGHGGRVMKGLATRRLYPDAALRHLGDVDLHFPTLDLALPCLRAMRDAGWAWDPLEVPWIKWDERGTPYGQWGLARDIGHALPVRVDVHVGPYSVGHLGLLPVLGFTDGCVDGVRLPCTGPEVSLAVLAAHAETESLLSFKDVNDAYVLSRAGPVDWQSTRELCRAAGVERALAELMARVRAAYGTPPPARRAAPAGSVPTRRVGRLRRALRTVRLTFRQERRRRSAAAALARLPGCFRYFTADLRPRATDRAGPRPAGRLRRRWLCWRLLPESIWSELGPAPSAGGPAGPGEVLAGGLELLDDGRACVARLGGDVFVPTLWGPVSRRALGLAAVHRERPAPAGEAAEGRRRGLGSVAKRRVQGDSVDA